MDRTLYKKFIKECDRRDKKYKGKYDIGDLAYELYVEAYTYKKQLRALGVKLDKINYGL